MGERRMEKEGSHQATRGTRGQALVKVCFPLSEQDAAMGVKAENLWAQPLESGGFRIDNIPFYVYGVSNKDVVSAELIDGSLQFQSVLSRGGHSTYRVLVRDPAGFESAPWRDRWARLAELGCSYEVAKQRYIAIDVPKLSSADVVYAVLEKGAADGIWSIDEGHCGHPISEGHVN
jgi:hypothetical protein